MVTTAQVAEMRATTTTLTELAGNELTAFWDALYSTLSPDEFRAELLKFFPDLVTTYGETAAVVGADWYELMRQAQRQGVSVQQFRATIAMPVVDEQSIASAKWALGPFFDAQADSLLTLERLHGSLQRFVLQPFRDSIWYSAAADPVRTGVLRLPRGQSTCRFCVMLASRGAEYRYHASGITTAGSVVGAGSTRTGYDANGRRLSGGIGGGIKARGAQDLGNSFHDDCDCATVIIQSRDDYPEDYDRQAYINLYAQGSGIGRDLPNWD